MEKKRLEFRFDPLGRYIPLIAAAIFILIAGTHQANVNGYCLAFFAAVIAFVVILICGGSKETAVNASELTFEWKSLLMILVPVIIIVCCLKKIHLIASLSFGILAGILIGLLSGLYNITDIFSYPGGWTVDGIFINAITGTVGTVFMLYGVFMLLGIMQASGVVGDVSALFRKLARGTRSAEAIIGLSVGIMGWITGVVAVGMVAMGDFIREMGAEYGINKYRRANLMDCAGLSITALAPWTVHAVLPVSLAAASADVTLTPMDVVTHNYYCIILLIIMAVSIITRYGTSNDPEKEGE